MSDLRPTTATRQRTLNFRLRLILKYGLLRGPVPRMASSTSKPPSKPVQALELVSGSQTYLNYILWIWECQGFQIDKFCAIILDTYLSSISFPKTTRFLFHILLQNFSTKLQIKHCVFFVYILLLRRNNIETT